MKTGLTLLVTASVIGLSAASYSALADDDRRGAMRGVQNAERMIERFDADGDNAVTLDEFMAGDNLDFTGADADEDGFVTEAELKARAADRPGRRADRMIGQMDVNDDGKVSRQEAMDHALERAEDRFASADVDDDGFITGEEARQIIGERGEQRRERAERRMGRRDHARSEFRRGHGRGHGKGHFERSGEDRAERLEMRAERSAARTMRQLDTDGDDKISRAEFDARNATRFAQLDKNDDGKIVAEELEGQMKRFRGNR